MEKILELLKGANLSKEATCLQTMLMSQPYLAMKATTQSEDSMMQEKRLTIDVDAYQPNEKWPNDWVTENKLTEADKRTLTSSSTWFSDAVINS